MIDATDNCCANAETITVRVRLRHVRYRIQMWLYLHVWCRHLYRPTMKVMHRFNLHYAPPNGLPDEPGKKNHWCQWCGLRGTTFSSILK